MKKIFIFFLIISASAATAQTLFTYGNHSVSKEEFLRAYNKNSNGEVPTQKIYEDYLNLYIRFKLKVQAAYDKGLDTLPSQVAELQSFRNQVIDSYITDDKALQQLIHEAFQRRQKDIHLAHIFIPFDTKNPADTSIAYKRAMDAYKELLKGTDFGNVARLYSADSSVQREGGDIGYITVFTLPYGLETLAYTTPTGKFSKPYRTKSGYHIFKNINERPAVGKLRVAQILLIVPSDATEQARNIIKLKADSIYNALQKGSSFKLLAGKLSNDNLTYLSGGEMPEFGIGTYSKRFENIAFGLAKNGEISKPFLDSDGYHIVKRLSRTPVNTNRDSVEDMVLLRQQVLNDARKDVMNKRMVERIYNITHLKKEDYNEAALWKYYRDHLEEYHPEFAAQMKEFKEGNLLFEMMQAAVWNKANEDSTDLAAFYQAHKEKNNWKSSAEALNDYQTYLEDKWIEMLKQKYPVKINEDVLKSLTN